MFNVGDQIGDYEIVANLKSGGMATLFLGRRAGAAGFAKHVAIKVVHEHLATDEQFVQMFVDEALLSARIHHPNVVHVEELRELEGTYFLVMEYVYGCSLSQLLHALGRRSRRLSAELATHIAIKVADGLHAAHEVRDSSGQLLNVVHRDVNPQNILLAYQGNLKLIDFGVAKAKGRAQQTEGGSIKGKFRYMSPEQAFARDLDRRTDVYALGIVLWEMLTMRRRFDGTTDVELINKVRNPDVLPPSRYSPDLPPELDAVVLKAMASNPDERYATAHELRDALVSAMPRAASLHESVLGKLLTAVMADVIQSERGDLPSGMSGLSGEFPLPESTTAEHTVAQMTVSATNVELLADGTSGDLLNEAPTRMLGSEQVPEDDGATIVAESSFVDAVAASAPGVAAYATGSAPSVRPASFDAFAPPSGGTPSVVPAAQKRSILPLVLGVAGAAVVVGLAFGVGVALVLGPEEDHGDVLVVPAAPAPEVVAVEPPAVMPDAGAPVAIVEAPPEEPAPVEPPVEPSPRELAAGRSSSGAGASRASRSSTSTGRSSRTSGASSSSSASSRSGRSRRSGRSHRPLAEEF